MGLDEIAGKKYPLPFEVFILIFSGLLLDFV
jgi:hypothetical protein